MVNAFWLDYELDRAASDLVDTHVTSCLLECSIVLTTAVQLNGYPRRDTLYYSHADHPLTRWCAESYENWQYLRSYTDAVHAEWRYRWDHADEERHGALAVVEQLDDDAVTDLDWPTERLSDPPQITGRWDADEYVDAYRYYYANEKRELFQWSKDRSKPAWIPDYVVEDG